jgi:acyl dehydratase
MRKIALNERLYRSLIGKTYEPFTVAVTAEQIRGYADAIGDRNPLRHDGVAARVAGFRDVTAPPTFGFTITLLANQSDLALADLGFTMNEALHGEEAFEYGGPICAGDVLTGRQHIADLREKKHGTLLFLVTKFQIANQLGEHVLDMTQTSIVPLVRLER